MEKKKNTPKLRFPEFTGEWEEKKLGEIVISLDSGVSVNSVNEAIKEESEYGILKTSCIISGMFYPDENKRIIDDEVSRARLNPCADSILISRMNTPLLVGESGYVSSNYSNLYIPDRLWMAKINHETTNSRLLSIILSSKKIKDKITNIATGTSGSMKNISKPNFLNLEIRIPTLLEQTKLATFLTAVDEKLTQLKKKKTLLEQYKKGVMQKLFSQELRFKDDNNQDFPDWQEKTLGEISNRVITKNKENNLNVLTISAQNGLVSQLEFFNKSVSAKDVTGYYLLDRNDFAYNKSYSNGYPMGAIKRLTRYEKGVVSTLYICFRNKSCFDNSFAEQYFETGLQNNELEKVAQEGARNHGLLNIGVSDFFKIELTIPSLPEQQKIATFLSAIDEKINQCSAQIEKMEAWKKGLLQQMFC